MSGHCSSLSVSSESRTLFSASPKQAFDVPRGGGGGVNANEMAEKEDSGFAVNVQMNEQACRG